MIIFQGHVIFGRIGIALLPVIVFKNEEIKAAFAGAFIIIAMTTAPIIVIGAKDHVTFSDDVVAAVIGVDAVAGTELIVNDVAFEFFAIGQIRAGQTLGVYGAAIGEQQEMMINQVIGDACILRIIGLTWFLNF